MKSKFLNLILSLIVTLVMVAVGSVAGIVIRNIEVQSVFATVSLNAQKTVKDFAKANGIALYEYPQELLELLENNPETEDLVINYPIEKNKSHEIDLSEYSTDTVPLFMQWDKRWGYKKYGNSVAALTACGPVCLSMVAYYYTSDNNMSPDKIMDFALKNDYYTKGVGSKWTLISKGGEQLGFIVDELPLDENVMIKALNDGKPIIAVMGAGSFTTTGHFIVFTDYSDGAFSVNDPNSHKNSNTKWYFDDIKDEFKNLWSIGKKSAS